MLIFVALVGLAIGSPIPDTKKIANESEDLVFVGDEAFTRKKWNEIHNISYTENMSAFAPGLQKIGNVTLWPENTIYYYIADNHFEADDAAEIRLYISALDEYFQMHTCVRIKHGKDKPYAVKVINGRSDNPNGCFSHKGVEHYEWNHQVLSLSKAGNCIDFGIVAHEFMHAWGFEHAHQRWDRKLYLDIFEQNIAEFPGQITELRESYGFHMTEAEFDFGSAMLYSPTLFAKERTFTMKPKNILKAYLYTMGSPQISFIDLHSLNKLYGCIDPGDYSGPCQNGGYRLKSDIGKDPSQVHCICPGGFFGHFCTETGTFPHTNDVYTSTDSYQAATVFSDGIQQKGAHILFNGGEFVLIDHLSIVMSPGMCEHGCPHGYIEFKTDESTTTTGFRVCCQNPKYNYYGRLGINAVYAYAESGYSAMATFWFKTDYRVLPY